MDFEANREISILSNNHNDNFMKKPKVLFNDPDLD